MGKTVKELAKEFEEFILNSSNVRYESIKCYGWEQVAGVLEEYNRYGELIEMKITSENEPGRNIYRLSIWHYPLLNQESRLEQARKGDIYQSLRDTKEHI